MEPIKIKLLTPIWTGGIEGYSKSLKMSGIYGGMRQCFEMLVRKHGGHTCDITSENADNRCSYELNADGKLKKPICPACMLFGCTGLARSFRIRIEGLQAQKVIFPETDVYIRNRNHHNQESYDCSIDTWLASTYGVNENAEMIGISEHTRAQILLNKITVLMAADEIKIYVDTLRKITWEDDDRNRRVLDLNSILIYLLAFMSEKYGLGAKIYHGWGIFEMLPSPMEHNADQGIKEIDKLNNPVCNNFNNDPNKKIIDANLPNANNSFYATWCDAQLDGKIKLKSEGNAWKPIGYALRYRLRRYIKFNYPTPQTYPWATGKNKAEELFGVSNSLSIKSGQVGVSHLYKNNDMWCIKLFGNLSDNSDKNLVANTMDKLLGNIKHGGIK